MEITTENPIRLLDLNKYPLTEEQANDKELIKWTKEILHTFTSNKNRYPNFKETVNENVYKMPVGAKLSKYGARHFVMKEQCSMTDEEIDKLRSEATDKYSPYWYGMISSCHFSGHITLKIAKMLFPSESWRIIQTSTHTFVSNIDLGTIINIFSNASPFSREVDTLFAEKYKEQHILPPQKWQKEWRVEEKEKKKETSKLLNAFLIDKADYQEGSPMIIDLLVTDKDTFLGLVARFNISSMQEFESSNAFRKSLVNVGNIRKVPITMKLRNYFYKNKKLNSNVRGEGQRKGYRTRKHR